MTGAAAGARNSTLPLFLMGSAALLIMMLRC
jgi:hypothetical protein